MNELIIKENINIENMIYEIRGIPVIMSNDIAKLYKVETKELNRQVRRNIERFPDDFCFQVTREEYYYILRCQNGTLELKQGQYSKYLPLAFTEHGISMLASVLHSDVAIKMSIEIIRAFATMRNYIDNSEYRLNNIETKIIEHDKHIKLLQESFDKLDAKKKNNCIYFSGQIYDAYSKIIDIFKNAKHELIIIDSYADKTILDIISNLKIPVTIICKTKALLTRLDIEKYNMQYSNLKIIYDNSYHDRYFILDKIKVYHCGASINRIGYKTFSITLMSDKDVINSLLSKLNSKKES